MSRFSEILRESPLAPAFKANGIREALTHPEILRTNMLYYSDVEGPLVTGDLAAEAMDQYVSGGKTLYQLTYEVHTEKTGTRRLTEYPSYKKKYGEEASPPLKEGASEATDIIFSIPILMAMGVKEKDIVSLGDKNSKPTPGAVKNLASIHEQGFGIVASTSSFKSTTERILKNHGMNVDHVIGTPLSLSEMEDILRDSKRYYIEMEMIQRFLNDCSPVIEFMNHTNDSKEQLKARQFLMHAIDGFYQNQLGISYDPLVRDDAGLQSPTLLGEMIEATEVVTDYQKGKAADLLYRGEGTMITVGDGLNDRFHLGGDGKYSEKNNGRFGIAVNGQDAVRFSDIGVVTYNMADIARLVEEITKRKPDTSLSEIIESANERVSDQTFVHMGGKYPMSDESLTYFVDLHQKAKNELRKGSGILIP